MAETIEGRGIRVEVDDPHGLITRWQRYGYDRLYFKGLKGFYVGLDDGNVPEFTNPAYRWSCEQLVEGGRHTGYCYRYRHEGGVEGSMVVRFI